MKRARDIEKEIKALQEELYKRQKLDENYGYVDESAGEFTEVEYLDPEFFGSTELDDSSSKIDIVDSDEDSNDAKVTFDVKPVKIDLATDKPLNSQILNILGDRVADGVKGPAIHYELAHRITHITRNGLTKEAIPPLIKDHPSPENCNIDSPKLNSEVAAAVSNALQLRDTKIKERQDRISAALSAVASGLTLAIEEGKNLTLIKTLTDATKLLAHLFYKESITRRSLLLPVLAPAVQTLSRDQPVDIFLFGESLSEKVKAAKAVERTAKVLKTVNSKPKNFQAPLRTQNNFKRGEKDSSAARSARGDAKHMSKPQYQQYQQYKPRTQAQSQRSNQTKKR